MMHLLLAAAFTRAIVFVDAGARPVYSIRIGHADGATWTDDLLGFAGALEVSTGRELRVALDDRDCVLDVRATFDDGTAVVVTAMDLCHTDLVKIPPP